VQFFCAYATQFFALHAPEILHRVAMKIFHPIHRKICQQNRFDSILLQSSATHFVLHVMSFRYCNVATFCSKFSWRKNFREKTKPSLESCMCLSDGGYTVQFQACAIQQIALHAHKNIVYLTPYIARTVQAFL